MLLQPRLSAHRALKGSMTMTTIQQQCVQAAPPERFPHRVRTPTLRPLGAFPVPRGSLTPTAPPLHARSAGRACTQHQAQPRVLCALQGRTTMTVTHGHLVSLVTLEDTAHQAHQGTEAALHAPWATAMMTATLQPLVTRAVHSALWGHSLPRGPRPALRARLDN